MQPITITLPTPPPEVRPNGRCRNWGKKHRLTQQCVERAKDQCVIDSLGSPRHARASIRYDWYHPTNRFLDRDNIIGACKPYLDGIVRAGILLDDNGITLEPVGRFKATAGTSARVEITITPTQEADAE